MLAFLGAICIPTGQAQEPTAAAATAAERAKLLEEQTRPRKQVPFNPKDFDKFAGYYQRFPEIPVFVHIYRNADRYYSQITGQIPVQIFPEGPSEFFATVAAAQISFDVGPGRQVTGLVLHQGGMLLPWKRVSTAAFEVASNRLQQRIKNRSPALEPRPPCGIRLRRSRAARPITIQWGRAWPRRLGNNCRGSKVFSKGSARSSQ